MALMRSLEMEMVTVTDGNGRMNQMSQMNQNQTLLNRKKLIEVTVAKIMENKKIELLDQLQEIAI
jgi:hypothetical protein